MNKILQLLLISVIALVLSIFLAVKSFSQTNYYVSNSGNDGNAGTSEGAAWATLTEVQSNMGGFSSGDSILFNRNDTFPGTLNVTSSGLVFGAYGTGSNPVFDGTLENPTWTNRGGNIWYYECTECGDHVANVWINGQRELPGKEPNGTYGFNYYTTGTSSSQIEDDFTAEGYASGEFYDGFLVVKSSRWTMDTLHISSQTSTTITTSNTATYGLEDNWGYFFIRHPNVLDLEGEWTYFHDTVMIYSSTDPNTFDTRIAVEDDCFTVGASNTTIENLTVYGYNGEFFDAGFCDNHTIKNCSIMYIGAGAIEIEYMQGGLFKNNYFQDINNNGIRINFSDSTEISNNEFRNIATIPGYGQSDNGNYIAIIYNYSFNFPTDDFGYALITNNYLDSIGYNGIVAYDLQDVIVTKNFINKTCQVKDDGSAIYLWEYRLPGTRIDSNIVMNGRGHTYMVSPSDTASGYQSGMGIYLDDRTVGTPVRYNTIVNFDLGIFLHNAKGTTTVGEFTDISHNTFYNNVHQIFSRDHVEYYLCTAWDINNNVFGLTEDSTSLDGMQKAYYLWTTEDYSFTDFDSILFNNNSFIYPFYDDIIFRLYYPDVVHTEEDFTLSEWQALEDGQDANSTSTPLVWDDGIGTAKEDLFFFDYNWSGTTKTIDLGSDYYLDKDSNLVTGDYDINPYSSTILLLDTANSGGVTQYTLSTNVTGSGTIDLSPSGGTYDENTEVTVTANPSGGWSFSSWSGDLSGSTNPESITMNENKSVTATFTEDEQEPGKNYRTIPAKVSGKSLRIYGKNVTLF